MSKTHIYDSIKSCIDLRGHGWVGIACSRVGLCSLGKLYVRESDTGFEARQGISLFGSIMSREGDPESPFENGYCENYCKGAAATEEDAIKALVADMDKTAEGLWD